MEFEKLLFAPSRNGRIQGIGVGSRENTRLGLYPFMCYDKR